MVQRKDNPTDPQASRCATSWEYRLPSEPIQDHGQQGEQRNRVL